jgi:hypothetical protein
MSTDLADNPNGLSPGSELIARGQTVQQVRSAFCTAVTVQQPRVIAKVKRNLLEEARLMGGDAFYGWRAGKETIEGPSIDLAVAAARCWGNCATDMLPVQDLPDSWIFTASFIDLETGYTRTRQFRQSKDSVIHGKLDEERKDDIRFQIGQSKAERNVILKALPSWLINQAVEAAKEGVRAELENLVKTKGHGMIADRLISALGKCGVKEAAILAKCGVAERKALSIENLVILRGDLNTLQSGQERVEVLFPAVDEPKQAAQPKEESPSKEPPAKKALKKTIKQIEDLCVRMGLSPAEKESLCANAGVQGFADLTEEKAQNLVGLLEFECDRQEQRTEEPTPREPGCDDAE